MANVRQVSDAKCPLPFLLKRYLPTMQWTKLRNRIHIPPNLSERIKKIYTLFSESIAGWSRNQASIYAAALAYFTIFSLAPLVIIAVGVASLVFNRAVVMEEIVSMIDDLVGADIAQFIAELVVSSGLPSQTTSLVATLIGLGVMLYAASLIFFKLQVSLNVMWDIEPKMEDVTENVLVIIKGRAFSTLAAFGVGFYLLVALILNNLWAALPVELVAQLFPNSENWVALLSFVVSPVMYMIPFGLIYKTLPQARVRWRDLWPGAALAATLFWIGGQLIGLYLTRSGATSVYGAAGSLVAFLIWIFYSAMVFLFGAKFAQVYAKMYGVPIQPDPNMVLRSTTFLADPGQAEPVSKA
jgi:membrane protein